MLNGHICISLLYLEERINDIIKTVDPVSIDSVRINDVIRVFKGDNPAAQLEAGQQTKGGTLLLFYM